MNHLSALASARSHEFAGGYSGVELKKYYDRANNRIAEGAQLQKEPGGAARAKRHAGLLIGSVGGAVAGAVLGGAGRKKVSKAVRDRGMMVNVTPGFQKGLMRKSMKSGAFVGGLVGLSGGESVDKHRATNQTEIFAKKKLNLTGKDLGPAFTSDPRLALSSRLDSRLREFAVIDTAEEPYNYGGGSFLSGDKEARPNFPSLYLSRSKDAGLMTMKGEGQALVNYKIKSRSVDESRADGDALYGASIEIRSIEEIDEPDECDDEDADEEEDANDDGADEADEGEDDDAELSARRFLRHFGCKAKGMKLGKKKKAKLPIPLTPAELGSTVFLRELGSAGFQRLKRVEGSMMKKLKQAGADTRVSNNTMRPLWKKQDAKFDKSFPKAVKWANEDGLPDRLHSGIGAQVGKRNNSLAGRGEASKMLSSTLFLRQFGEARDRDGEGRFSRGGVPSSDDYAIAGLTGKKKALLGVAGGTALAGAALGGTQTGRQVAGEMTKAAMRLGGRLLQR